MAGTFDGSLLSAVVMGAATDERNGGIDDRDDDAPFVGIADGTGAIAAQRLSRSFGDGGKRAHCGWSS